MSWDKSSKPKRLRRKHKRIIILVALVGSMSIVVVTGFWNNFMQEEHTGTLIKIADSMLNDEEKRTVWGSMNDDGKAVILKHAPDAK